MPAFDPVSAGIGAAVGLAQTVTGIVNNKKAKKAAAELERTRPTYRMSEEVGRELAYANSELANGGMSARAEAAYNNLTNQQFSSSLSGLLKGGGSVNNVAETFGASEEGRQRLRLLNDEMRLKQIDNRVRAQRYMAEQQDKEFMYNVDQPWKDKAAAVSAAREQAQRDIWGGVKTIGGTAMQAAASAYNWNRYEKMFKPIFNPAGSSPQPSANTTYTDLGRNSTYGDFENPYPEEETAMNTVQAVQWPQPQPPQGRVRVSTSDYDAYLQGRQNDLQQTGISPY